MGKIRKKVMLLLPVIFLLSGCRSAPEPAPVPIVTGIRVQCLESGATARWEYTDPQKMEPLLVYLASLHPYGIAERNPEQVIGKAYRIDIFMSDGANHIYRLRADRYYSKDSAPWRLVDPKQAALLPQILEASA